MEVGLPGVSTVHVVLHVELRTKLEVAHVHLLHPCMEVKTVKESFLKPHSVFKPHVLVGNVKLKY